MWHELPDGVLQIIAGRMHSQEWAKARGACQTFARVQPRRLALFPSNMAAVRWFIKLWQKADSVALNLGLLDPESSELYQILERGARTLQGFRLAELCVEGMPNGVRIGDSDCMKEVGWLEAVLNNACSLQRLVLESGSIIELPLLSRQLRHVVFHVHGNISRQACSVIEEMMGLQTISIRLQNAEMFDLPLPALDLSACKKLVAVDLQYIMPENLSVPTGCWVSMDCVSERISDASFECFPQVCTCFRFKPWGFNDTAGWCGMLCLSWPWLTSLEIDNTNILDLLGVTLVFGGTMPRLRSLNITSFHLVLRIEAPIRLHHLIITTHRICELKVEDVSLLVDEMATLTVTPWFGEKSVTVHDSGYDELLNAYAASQMRRGMSTAAAVQLVQTEGIATISDCACGGACLHCLRKVSKLQSFVH